MVQIDQSRWLATENITRLRILLTSSADNIRRRVLEDLLAAELENLRACSPDETDRDLAIPLQASLPTGEDHSADLPDDRTKPQ